MFPINIMPMESFDLKKTLFSLLLPDLDSNQDKQNQNLRYYRYTIGH